MHPIPAPTPRPAVVAKVNPPLPPPVSARPSAAASRAPLHKPVKVYGAPSAVKRPGSAASASGSRSVSKSEECFRDQKCVFLVSRKRRGLTTQSVNRWWLWIKIWPSRKMHGKSKRKKRFVREDGNSPVIDQNLSSHLGEECRRKTERIAGKGAKSQL